MDRFNHARKAPNMLKIYRIVDERRKMDLVALSQVF
jgi:hypothetical protein